MPKRKHQPALNAEKSNPGFLKRSFAVLGPGLITGAADDDPSGINGLLAPPLIVLVILLTSSRRIMGQRANSRPLRYLGWATFAVMAAAAVGMIVTS